MRLPWLLLFPLVHGASACTDNVACVFTGGCQGGTGAISDNEAALPVDGDWIVDGPPVVQEVFPSGTTSAGTTPIVIVFSESMLESTLLGAIEVFPLVSGGVGGPPIVGFSLALVADGRVLVLLPPTALPLAAGDYLVQLAEDAVVTDLTGQALELAGGATLGQFGVPLTPPAAPQLVMTFPPDGAANQSETPEILAVFDRPVVASSVDPDSFDVRVDGVDPLRDPPATPLVVQVGISNTTDTRAFLYRSLDVDGRALPLGTNAEVELRLSPAGSPIREEDGGELAAETITFRTVPFSAPLGASFLSDPMDAIGLANLTDGDAEELAVEVELAGAEPNDSIDLLLFGVQRSDDPDPPLIALQRSVRLTGSAPIQSVIFAREDVALQFSSAPDDVRFEDGSVTFAFRSRRGSVVTPMRVLDLDPDPETILDPLLDTQVPTVEALVGSPSPSSFRSDQRGLSLAGQADGRVSVVEVTTPFGATPALAPVVGATDDGLFLAAPVDLGGILATGSTTYSFVARDAARNSSPTVAGTYTQLGAVGPGALVPGQDIAVEVFDAGTRLGLAGARVLVHSDRGNGLDYPLVDSDLTLNDGRVTVSSEGAPSQGAIVTVILPGYDLFTLHGVPSSRLSVPLRRSSQAPARAAGQVVTTRATAVAVLPDLDRRYDDSRRSVQLPRGFEGSGCTVSLGTLVCAYGPQAIRELDLGARSVYAGDFTQTEAGFQSSQLLRAFALSVPLAPADPNVLQNATLEIPYLLDDPSTPAEEAAVALPPFRLVVDPAGGVDLLDLEDDPATSGAPFATVETLVPGLPGALAVSAVLTFDQGGGAWSVRGAVPGAVTAAGSLGAAGSVETDPYVRVEVVDGLGNASGVRPRLSDILAGAPAPEFRALAVPAQLAPAAGGASGGQAFDLVLRHAIGDDRSEAGLYRAELQDVSGRRWTLWRLDPPGSADVSLRVVDVGEAGATGLANGALVSRTEAYAWEGLEPTAFLWSDVERRFELFSRAAPLTFSKP